MSKLMAMNTAQKLVTGAIIISKAFKNTGANI